VRGGGVSEENPQDAKLRGFPEKHAGSIEALWVTWPMAVD